MRNSKGTPARTSFGVCLTLVVATVAIYWPVARFDFINYDDPDYVTENSWVQHGLTWAGVAWAFQTGYAGNWHPLTWLSHMLDWQLYGLKAGGHHLTSLLLHLANTLLLLLVLRRMTGALWRSLFVAALFALHPLHVESVAWVAERKDVLSTFFGLLSLLAYVSYVQRSEVRGQRSGIRDQRPRREGQRPEIQFSIFNSPSFFYVLALLLFTLSLMSKPMLVTLPFLLLLLDYWPLQRFEPKTQNSKLKTLLPLLREKLPFFVLAAASSITTFFAQQRGGTVASFEHLTIGLRIENALLAYATYLKKTFWPDDLAVFYPHPGRWLNSAVIVAGFLIIAISVFSFLSRRRRPYLLTGWLWFLGTLAPVIGFVQVGSQSMADRYTYVPLVGIFLLLVWGAGDLLKAWRCPKIVLATGLTLGLAALTPLTWRQVQSWKNSETLFAHAIKVTANNYVAHNNLGIALYERGKTNEALAHYSESIRIKPDNPNALTSLGMMLSDQGKTNEAIQYYSEALRFDPHFSEAHYNLGIIAFARGDDAGAVAHFQSALAARPDYPAADYNLAIALAAQGKTEEAMPHYAKALRLKPNDAESHNNLGVLLANGGQLKEATAHFAAAVEAKPSLADAHQNLAVAQLKQGRIREGLAEYRAALRWQPQWPEVLNNLAWLLATHPDAEFRNGAEAVQLATRACDLTGWTNLWLLATLAAAYAEAGLYPQAVETIQKAIALAQVAGQTTAVAKFRTRLALYQAGKPWHEAE